MKMNRSTRRIRISLLTGLAMIALSQAALAEEDAGVVIPPFTDKYSEGVRRLEAGDTNLDYREFRNEFLESKQFEKAAGADLDSLRKAMRDLIRKSRTADVILVAKRILSIDYTDMEAHKVLRQAYGISGDTLNQKKHHDIEFGLLNSIVKNGDGETCRTAWPVVQVTEEYFILDMIGARVLKQSIDASGPCDRMEVEADGAKKVFYFNVAKVFEGYHKQGIP